MQTLNLIQKNLNVSDRIAIVGSSGILKNSDYGRLIDSFDDVVRFNRAPTEEFEEIVGSKTTIRVVNNHVFNGNKLDPKKWTNQPADFVKDLRHTKIVYFAGDMGPWMRRNKKTDNTCELYRFQYEYMDSLKKAVGYKGKPFSVGVGFIAVCIASGVKPHLFGFDIDPRERDHYFEDCPPPGPTHARSKEQEFLKKMVEEDRIVIYT